MKQLLRNLIDYSGSIGQELLTRNLQSIITSRYEFDRPDDIKIFSFLKDYFQAQMALPSVNTVAHFFESTGETDIVERLKDIAFAEPFTDSNYLYILKHSVDERNRQRAVQLLKESQEIVAKGLDIEGDRKFGVRDGFAHFAAGAADLTAADVLGRCAGNILEEGQEVWEQYLAAEANKGGVWGKFTGINEIDVALKGLKRGELWIHGAAPGEGKTTFALNWAYNLVTRYRTNVIYWSMEMPREQLRLQVYALHSANLRFRTQGKKPLDYDRVKHGQLTVEEKAFFQEVIQDFNSNPEYCSLDIRDPKSDVTIDDLRMDTELAHRTKEIGLMVIDHGQLVEARKKKRSKDYVVELNSVVRDAKKLALHFANGEGIPVLLLWQINRQGKEEADKNDGRYTAKAFTYANEVEKSADILTTTYLNESLRALNTIKFSNLKARDTKAFAPFEAATNLTCRLIHSRRRFEDLPTLTGESPHADL